MDVKTVTIEDYANRLTSKIDELVAKIDEGS